MKIHSENCIKKATKIKPKLMDVDKKINEICEQAYKKKNNLKI